MILKDLLMTNGSITSVDITIRDEDGLKLSEIRIGKYARADKFPDATGKPRWDIKRESINFYDKGRDYWGYVPGSIPKQLEEMEVTHWTILPESRNLRATVNDCKELYVDILKEGEKLKGEGWRVIEEKTVKNNTQLEGQLSLFDNEK